MLDVPVAELQQSRSGTNGTNYAADHEPETLADAMAEAKRKIADVAGIDPSAITISIDY